MPSLAGQPKQFITTQFVMFREGNRKNPAMNAVTTGTSNADINALGRWLAAQTQVPAAAPQGAEQAAADRKLAEQFQCTQCHRAELKGQQHIPRLAGQQADYLRAQLRGFKAGTRDDMDGNVTSAAQPLSTADMTCWRSTWRRCAEGDRRRSERDDRGLSPHRATSSDGATDAPSMPCRLSASATKPLAFI